MSRAPDKTRTYDLSFTKALLYPTELRRQGWGGRDRTCDLEVNSFPLLPLSYTPIFTLLFYHNFKIYTNRSQPSIETLLQSLISRIIKTHIKIHNCATGLTIAGLIRKTITNFFHNKISKVNLEHKSPSVSGWTRTSDRLLRRQLLYPTELLRHKTIIPNLVLIVNGKWWI